MHELLRTAGGWLVNHPEDFVLRYLTHSAVTLAVVGAMAWLGDRMLGRVGPRAQHRMWVAALVAGVALPLLPADVFTRLGHLGGGAAGGYGTASITYHAIAAASGHWTVPSLLCTVLAVGYLLTVVFSLAGLQWRWARTRAMARRSVAFVLDGSARALVEDAARRFAIGRPEVRCSRETRGPVVLGMRRAVLLVPERFFDTPREDAAAALAHECAHAARRDFAKNLLYEFVAAAVSYHPACRLMRRRIAQTRELVCDEMAAGRESERPEYAASLLRLATAMAVPAARASHAIGVFDANTLEERIMRLTVDVPKVSRARKIAMVTVTATVLLGGASASAAISTDIVPLDGAAARPTREKVYNVGGDVTTALVLNDVPLPLYPTGERYKPGNLHAKTILEGVIDSHGKLKDLHVIRSPGPDFSRNTIAYLRLLRFAPATRKGRPVATRATFKTQFREH
ncbi:MAG TPA: M56 family metallopeptidase [Acidobacteriaceae bacterium]